LPTHPFLSTLADLHTTRSFSLLPQPHQQRATDASAYTLTASETTPAQSLNAELSNFTGRLARGLAQAESEAPDVVLPVLLRLREVRSLPLLRPAPPAPPPPSPQFPIPSR
jgi:hypothetical protein